VQVRVSIARIVTAAMAIYRYSTLELIATRFWSPRAFPRRIATNFADEFLTRERPAIGRDVMTIINGGDDVTDK